MKPEPSSLHRCAIYFAPTPDSPWWRAGSQWLGRCAVTGAPFEQPAVAGVSPASMRQLTTAPRRYGWHATLKAPFALAAGVTLEEARGALRALARQMQPFNLPPLQVANLGRFLALVPQAASAPLQAAAQACVTQLHHLAAPLDDAELQRRRGAGLTPAQETLLQRWGYPWVFEHFQFHLSLTGDLGDASLATQQALADAAQAHFGSLGPGEFRGLSLFVEPTEGADFMLLDHVELGA